MIGIISLVTVLVTVIALICIFLKKHFILKIVSIIALFSACAYLNNSLPDFYGWAAPTEFLPEKFRVIDIQLQRTTDNQVKVYFLLQDLLSQEKRREPFRLFFGETSEEQASKILESFQKAKSGGGLVMSDKQKLTDALEGKEGDGEGKDDGDGNKEGKGKSSQSSKSKQIDDETEMFYILPPSEYEPKK